MPEAKKLDWRGYALADADPQPWDKFKLQSFEPKKAGDYDVDISVEACGVCGSDTHTITGGWGPVSVKPLITGHEAAGVVASIGSKVSRVKVGDRVGVGAQVWSCNECDNCKGKNKNYCLKQVGTYNASYPDGSGDAQGGYAGAIRVREDWVFQIPDNLEFKEAGPLMCAGVTVYSPLKRNGCGPGKKVGILGIGGLGHLAVQFAKVMGAHVTAFTTQSDKAEDAKKMGADETVIEDKDGKYAEKLAGQFDLLLSTIDNANGVQIKTFASMLKVNKPLAIVGFPDEFFKDFHPMQMASTGAYLGVSHIGDPTESEEMLQIASKHGIKPWLEEHPMKDAGKANKLVNDNKVRYRGVLIRDF